MADPLSVTGSAVGMISLGITVCQSLVSYYSSWKDYEDDIRRMHLYLEDVSNRLQAIQTILQSSSFPAAARPQVESAVLLCTGDIRILEKELVKIQNGKLPVGLGDKIKAHLRRAQYPFKEATLGKLKDSVIALQTNLGVALSLLSV